MYTKSVLFALAAVCVLACTLTAQEVEVSVATGPAARKTTPEKTEADQPITMNDLLGSPAKRFWRGWQYKYQYVEQPSLVSIGSGSKQQIIANPEHNLNQHSFTFDFSQVFPTSQQLAQAIQKYKSLNPEPDRTKYACAKENSLLCILEAGGWWRRALSGLSATASASEHGQVSQGFLVTPGYLFAGEVDFDPKQMFISGTDWKNVVTAMKDIKDGVFTGCEKPESVKEAVKEAVKQAGEQKETDVKNAVVKARRPFVRKCYQLTTGATHTSLFALLPSFQYKRQTPFDFLKYGGGMIPSSTESGLNTWTVTLDVRRLIAGISPRVDAFEAADTIIPKADAVIGELSAKLCILKTGTGISYITVDEKVSAALCQKLATDLNADSYQLGCASDKEAKMGEAVQTSSDRVLAPAGDSCHWFSR